MLLRCFTYLLINFITVDLYTYSKASFSEQKEEDILLERPDCSQIIQEVQGYRPVREGGPRFEVEIRTDKKTTVIIHNYGYGSSGVTLAPGGAKHCLDLLQETIQKKLPTNKKVAVVGSGIVGLTMANFLQDLNQDYEVTIYTESNPFETVSNIAGGLWAADPDEMGKVPNDLFKQLQEDSFDHYISLMQQGSSEVHLRPIYSFCENTYLKKLTSIPPLKKVHVMFQGGGNDQKVKYKAWATETLQIDVSSHLQSLLTSIERKGGRLLPERKFTHLGELTNLDESIVFNCSGMGIEDPNTRGVQGKLVLLQSQNNVDYIVSGVELEGASNGQQTYMIPRTYNNAVGGSYGEDFTYKEIIENAKSFFYDPSSELADPVQ